MLILLCAALVPVTAGAVILPNPPAIARAVHQPPQTRVAGTYDGKINQAVVLDFYRAASCDGSGLTWIGSLNARTDAQGNLSFETLVAEAALGTYVMATATDTFGRTSEFSPCRQVVSGTPAVATMSPQSGRYGTVVTITGTNLGAVTAVKFFNGYDHTVNASFTLFGDTMLTTIVPNGARTGSIRLFSPYGTADTPSFRVTPPAGDMNGDGKPDLIWRNYLTGEGFISIHEGTNERRVWLPEVYDPLWQIQGTGDFNNDGHHDIVWRHYGAAGPNRVWFMNGTLTSGVEAALPSIGDPSWHIAAVADFDADGDPDLVLHHHEWGMGRIIRMNGTEWSGSTVILPTRPAEWRIEAAADFDLDGATDLLWRNYATGENVIWHMNGTSWSGVGTSLQTIPDPDWVIEAAVDWDRDGDPDIVWRNIGSGDNAVWLMIGTYWGGASVTLPLRSDTQLRIEDY